MSRRPLILLSNDDGVFAPGLRALAATMAELGEVLVVAPDRERSAASHAISLDRPLRVDDLGGGFHAVSGTPVDCVYLGVLHLCPRRPDLCIAGINHGLNLGSDVFYSGTVAAAVEAALRGVPSIAVSLDRRGTHDFGPASALVRGLAEALLARGEQPIPPGTLLNVNCPAGPIDGCEATFLGRRVYRDQVEVRADLRGRTYYWIGGPEEDATDLPGSDLAAVRAGRGSVTPLGLDLTHRTLLRELGEWDVRGLVKEAAAG